MARTAEILTSAIVAIGDFNPAIFSPDWLQRNALIGEDDANSARDAHNAKSLLLSHQVSAFETKWFSLQVLENRFSLTSKDALSPAFRDLAVGIFQLLPHTPITAVGLNFLAHFKLENEDAYHRVGDALAPKEVWQRLYPEEMPGLANLTVKIQRGTRGEGLKTKDEKRISVQPSGLIRYGAFLSYNDHHDLSSEDQENLPAERAAAVIDNEWEPAWRDAIRVFDVLLSTALQ